MNFLRRINEEQIKQEVEQDFDRGMETAFALAAQEAKPEQTLIEKGVEQVENVLMKLRADEAKLEAVIAERSERLRQTKISIEAFNLALAHLNRVDAP